MGLGLKVFGWLVLAMVFLAGLGFIGNALGLGSYAFWAPKQEAVRREVFEETPSYVHGKRQYLSRIYGQWQAADSAHRGVLCATARHEASTLDPNHLPSNLKDWSCVR